MIPKENLKDLKLNPEQMAIYKGLEVKERMLRHALQNAGIKEPARSKIVDATDLNKVDCSNVDLLKEQIVETWSDFIY